MTLHTPEPTAAPVVSGSLQLRVRYCECDPMGVAHHASYIPWLEMGRTELLRDSGITYAQLEAAGTLLVIVRLDVRYRRPCRYDDLLEIRTRWVGGSRVKIEHEYEVVVLGPGAAHPPPAPAAPFTAAVATTTLACVGRDGRIRELPRWLVPAKQ
ncbi:MAG: acyl-CoA thioesterase [Phycisphaeraceae bacterium]|nr:acyl-CoA thioesterase [Phycisphaeraceae bacterium]